MRNGMFFVTSNLPTSLSGTSTSGGANSDNPLRALDALMRGLPPPAVSRASQASPDGVPSSSRTGSTSGPGGTTAAGDANRGDNNRSGDGGGKEEEDRHEQAQEQEQAMMKALAARSLEALRHLHATRQLSQAEKTVLSSDVIQCLSQGSYSQVEMAYALLILGKHRCRMLA